jgi:hypothetical protein
MGWDQNTWNTIPVSGQKTTISKRIIEHWIIEQSELNKNRTDWISGWTEEQRTKQNEHKAGRIQDNEHKTTGQCSTSWIPWLQGQWSQVKARPFTSAIRQGFQLFCVWGRWHKPRINSWWYSVLTFRPPHSVHRSLFSVLACRSEALSTAGPPPATTNRLFVEPGGSSGVNCAWVEVSRGRFVGWTYHQGTQTEPPLWFLANAPTYPTAPSCFRNLKFWSALG